MKMLVFAITKIIPIICIIFSIYSMAYFMIGITAGFNRGFDVIATTLIIVMWIPILIFTLIAAILLYKGWNAQSVHPAIYITVFLSVFISVHLIKNVSPEGWLTEIVRSDPLKVTSDNKYEYRLDLINLFQNNSGARLYTKSLSTGEEKTIPIAIQTRRITGLNTTYGQENHWILMEPIDIADQYIVETTEGLNRNLYEVFEVNIATGEIKRLAENSRSGGHD